jgi:hypothetical protein
MIKVAKSFIYSKKTRCKLLSHSMVGNYQFKIGYIFSGPLYKMLIKKIVAPLDRRIKHQCRETTVLTCHRCLINTGVENMNNI